MTRTAIAIVAVALCGVASADTPAKPIYLTCSGTSSYTKLQSAPEPWNVDLVVDLEHKTVNGGEATISVDKVIWFVKEPASIPGAEFREKQCYLGRVGLHLQCFMAPNTSLTTEGNADCLVTNKKI